MFYCVSAKEVWQQFKNGYTEDYIELLRDFEVKKRDVRLDSDDKITLRIPISLSLVLSSSLGKTLLEAVSCSKYKEKVTVAHDKIRVDNSVFVSLFTEPINSIVNHVKGIFKEVLNTCKAVVMVGGFSESKILQENLKKEFADIRVIIPNEPGLAILKGAVIFGHCPKTITERVCKYTYGMSMAHKYTQSCTHKVGLREKDRNGIMRCYGIFDVHVAAGRSVSLETEQDCKRYFPLYEDQKFVSSDVFSSINPNVELVTEESCRQIGTLTVPVPENTVGEDRAFDVSFLVGGTEIEVKVKHISSGQVHKTRVDFLG